VKFIRRLLREPLLHFLLIAAALFALAGFWGDSPQGDENDKIVVSQARILSLAQMWHRTWQRPPTETELDGVINDFINEEVCYREALKMGLDTDDTIIRRRLRQKLEFVAADLADTIEPTDEELQKHLEEYADTFRLDDRLTLTQVYLSPKRRGKTLKADAKALLDKLRGSRKSFDAAELGDPLLLSHHYEDIRAGEIANLFGREFASEIQDLETGKWGGPIKSSYGVHLVLIEKRTAGGVPELDQVRHAVRRHWQATHRAVAKDDFYKGLRKRYEIVVEMPETTADEDSAAQTP
jgi:hypothetical protein